LTAVEIPVLYRVVYKMLILCKFYIYHFQLWATEMGNSSHLVLCD